MQLASEVNLVWAILAVVLLSCQIPLAGGRLLLIFNALNHKGARGRPADLMAITAIGAFFAQTVPNVAADAIRVWLLTRIHPLWQRALASVVIDRAAGVFMLFVLAFIALLSRSALSALGGYRGILLAALGTGLAAGVLILMAAPWIALTLQRWPATEPIARFATAARRVLVGRVAFAIFGIALAIHFLAILAILLLGKSQGLVLPLGDAAVLFALMTAAAIVPISIGGWALRELAVTALLQSHGFPPERALFFSVLFGLSLIVASLPGAIVWAVYVPAPATADRAVDERTPSDG